MITAACKHSWSQLETRSGCCAYPVQRLEQISQAPIWLQHPSRVSGASGELDRFQQPPALLQLP